MHVCLVSQSVSQWEIDRLLEIKVKKGQTRKKKAPEIDRYILLSYDTYTEYISKSDGHKYIC